MTSQDLPIACSLTATELPERLAEMAALGRDALTDVRVDGAVAQLRFAAGEGVRERVAALVEAEAACCAFLTLEVTDAPDAIVLDVQAPDDAAPVLAEWVATFQGATVTA